MCTLFGIMNWSALSRTGVVIRKSQE